MELNDYQKGCLTTWTGENRVERAFLGLAGEVGEVMEARKKYLRGDYERSEYIAILTKELGDALFYASVTAHEEGIEMDVVAKKNQDKLQCRKSRGKIQGSGNDR